MRLPTKLAFTAFHVAVAGTIACSAKTDHGVDHAADAAPDAPMEAASDAAADVADAALKDAATQDVSPMEASIVDAGTDALDACVADYFCSPTVADAACPGAICDESECPFDAGCQIV